ncbi:MAG: hydroxyacylglutathione hydrolase [Planctomycetota bacterium]|jgi:hydroxyacylglutathione hydrolase
MTSVTVIPAFGDNFIYLYEYEKNKAFAVDPCDSSLVVQALNREQLELTTIFVTHHHWDHTAGILDLKKKTGCQVIGGDQRRIKGIDRVVGNGQVVKIGNTEILVIATPGHTRTSLSYYIAASIDNNEPIVWTGDTMFINGCGRLCECDAETMLDSLLNLASLPADTLVYCGHDYTVENYEFALSIELHNKAVKERLREVKETLRAGGYPVGSTILQERKTNPFLRTDTAGIKAALDMANADQAEVFAEMRRRKDVF